MADRTLRALARQFAKGELDKDAYRQSRAEFIDGVLAGEIRLKVNEYPAPRSLARSDNAGEAARKAQSRRDAGPGGGAAEMEDIDTTSIMVTTDPTPQRGSSLPKTEPLPVPPAPEPEPRSPLPWILAAAGGIVLIGIVMTVLPSKSPPQAGGTAVSPPPGPAATEAGSVDAGSMNPTAAAPESVIEESPPTEPAQILSREASDLILVFLANKNWSVAARSEFLSQWQALPEDQRAGAAQSGEMAQLNNSIYKRLQAERALSGLGDDAASLEKQRSLIDFAAALGIQDPRLSIPSTPR